VVLDHRTVDDVTNRLVNPATADSGIERGLDRVQGTWKLLTTLPNPGFHSRNLIGDSLNAWLGDTHARSFAQSFKAMRALHQREKALGTAAAVTGLGPKRLGEAQRALSKTIDVGGNKMAVADLLDEAERDGAIRTGQAGFEYRQLLGGDPKRLGRLRAIGEYREDFPRFASFLAARKRGLDAPAAAEWSLKHHFDYGDLTSFERRVARRAFPFWTFFARNTRLQAEKLFTRPGKFATIEKALEESAKAAGFSSYEDFVGGQRDYTQRGIPLPLKVGGKVYNVLVSPPTTDLNQLTVNPADQYQNLGQRITFFKTIPEIASNYSVFFQDKIQKDDSPLVPAPQLLGDLPGPLRDKLGVRKYLDKRSGKMVWGWPAKVDYVARQLPQTNLVANLSSGVAGSRKQGPGLGLLGYLSGVKLAPTRPLDDQIANAYDQLTKVQNQLGALRQRGIDKDHSTPEYQHLLDQQKLLQQATRQLKAKRGDKVLPKQGAPSKGGSNPFDSGGGASQPNPFKRKRSAAPNPFD
jgi:hypothetical protein